MIERRLVRLWHWFFGHPWDLQCDAGGELLCWCQLKGGKR